ncbi:MAG: hypothetical protein OXF68_08820 [Gammaproteobacteria bacterium]|nr:hypothetical protein [Gammaproteobacteria bacterium]
MSEQIAWTVALAAALLVFVGIYALTRPLRGRFLRAWLRALSLALMLTPAPVPNFAGYYAPAAIVALFEAAFQRQGEPAQSLKLLLATGLLATVAAALWSWLGPRRRQAKASGGKGRQPE